MTDKNDDPGIPTLTQRAPSRHEPPVLTQQADDRPPWDVPTQPSVAASAPFSGATPDPYSTVAPRWVPGAPEQPSESVLRAALQADIEDAVQEALEEAMHLVRARLEARIPVIVAQAVKRTRMG